MAMKSVRSYHHGDLRTALVQAGLALLEERQSDDVGLREVARAVGVSATAIYRHFPDKAALLRALAAEGLDRLARVQKAAFDRAGGGRTGFAETGRAYVRFALDNPALFRLIFSSVSSYGPMEAQGEIPEAFRMLRENAKALLPAGAIEADVRAGALGAWAQVHGLAVLMLDGQLPRDQHLIDAVIHAAGSRH